MVFFVMSESVQGMKDTQPGPKRRRLQLQRDLVVDVANGTITRQALEKKLLEHIESVDASMVCPLPAVHGCLAQLFLVADGNRVLLTPRPCMHDIKRAPCTSMPVS
jgi:hypothetical protein